MPAGGLGPRIHRLRSALHYAVRHRQCAVGQLLVERHCPLAAPCAEDLRERLLPGDSGQSRKGPENYGWASEPSKSSKKANIISVGALVCGCLKKR